MPFAEIIGTDGGRRWLQNLADDLLQMLLRVGDVHVLVVADERGLPRLLLGKIGQPVSAPANLMLGGIARRTLATGTVGLNLSPRLRGVGPHAAETVLGDFDWCTHRGRAGGHVVKPAVRRTYILHYSFIKPRRLVHERLNEIASCYYLTWWAWHKSSVFQNRLLL